MWSWLVSSQVPCSHFISTKRTLSKTENKTDGALSLALSKTKIGGGKQVSLFYGWYALGELAHAYLIPTGWSVDERRKEQMLPNLGLESW